MEDDGMPYFKEFNNTIRAGILEFYLALLFGKKYTEDGFVFSLWRGKMYIVDKKICK